MQTQILKTDALRPPVGQLAKTPIFLLKTNENKVLRVGRHKNKTSRRSALTHQSAPALDFNTEKLFSFSDLELKNYLITVLTDQLPELDLFVHNGDYMDEIQDNYSSKETHIFKLLLRLFALQNQSYKTQKKNKLIITTETNFLQVFQFLKKREHYKLTQQIKPQHKQTVLEIIHEKINIKKFDIDDITNKIYILNQQVQLIFDLLVYEKVILKFSHPHRLTFYTLTQKPFSYVTCK